MNIDKIIRHLNQIKEDFPNANIVSLVKICSDIRYTLEDDRGLFIVLKSVKGR